MVNIICESLRNLPQNLKEHLLLQADRNTIERYEKAINKKNAMSFVVGAAALKYLAGKALGLPLGQVNIQKDLNGKPYIYGSELFISLSHSDEYILAVISDCKIGCDIQRIKKFKYEPMRPFWTPQDYNYISGSKNPDISFTSLWTRKECLVKLFGSDCNKKSISFYDLSVLKAKFDVEFISTEPFCDVISAAAIQGSDTVLTLKGRQDLRGDFSSCKAEEESGLSPADEENTAGQKINRKDVYFLVGEQAERFGFNRLDTADFSRYFGCVAYSIST
jgi:phosphopantetheinyl transferase